MSAHAAPPGAAPPRGDLRSTAVVALATAGAALVSVTVVIVVLQKASLGAATGAILALAAGGLALVALAPQWLLPAWIALTWASLGQSVYGGLPSPVQLGGIFFALIGLALLARRSTDERRALALGLPVVAALALPLLVSALLSPEGQTIPRDQLRDLAFIAAPALLVRSRDDVERVVVALVVCGIVLGIGAAYSVLVHPTAIFKLDGALRLPNGQIDIQAKRAAGPFGESNFFALSLAVLAPLALHVASRGRWYRVLGIVGVLALAAGILASGSRGALIAFTAAALGHAMLSSGRARAWAVAGVVAVVALMPLFSLQLEAANKRAVSGRATENRIAVAMWQDHPITGVGPLVYPVLYRDYARNIGNDPRPQREPHSLPLEILAEQGIAGVVGWLTAFGLLGAAVLRTRILRVQVGRAVVLSIATYGVCSLFLHGSQLRLLYLLLGLVLAMTAIAARAQRPGAPARG